MADGFEESLQAASASRNTHGRIYEPGKAYGWPIKLEVAEKYNMLKNESENGMPPSSRALGAAANVSPSFAQKILDEIETFGDVIPPEDIVPMRPRGVGGIALDEHDERLLLYLRFIDPSRTNKSYVDWLRACHGTIVSESLISDWFKNRFTFNASFRSTSTVPIDKFKPENILRYQEYVSFMNNPNLDHRRIKFADEKSLKGEEVFNRRVRPDPITGITPPVIADSDFRNSYCIMGFCGVDPTNAPFQYTIGEENHNSECFIDAVCALVGVGWLKRHDILVVDNSQVHPDELRDLLWNTVHPIDGQPLHILLMFLPTRSPELNPIEPLWHTLVMRLKALRLQGGWTGRDMVFLHAQQIMRGFDHGLVARTYNHCGYNV